MHVNKTSRLYESAVLTWILDDRISGEIEWTALDASFAWRKCGPEATSAHQEHIFAACDSAACDGCTRRLKDWVGNSSGVINSGGRQAKASQTADGVGGGAGPPPRTAPRRGRAAGAAGHSSCPRTHSPEQAAARVRLLKMGASCLCKMYRTILPNDRPPDGRSLAGQPKQSLVEC